MPSFTINTLNRLRLISPQLQSVGKRISVSVDLLSFFLLPEAEFEILMTDLFPCFLKLELGLANFPPVPLASCRAFPYSTIIHCARSADQGIFIKNIENYLITCPYTLNDTTVDRNGTFLQGVFRHFMKILVIRVTRVIT